MKNFFIVLGCLIGGMIASTIIVLTVFMGTLLFIREANPVQYAEIYRQKICKDPDFKPLYVSIDGAGDVR